VIGLRGGLARDVLGLPTDKVRVLTGNVGGSFGMKSQVYPEYGPLLLASKRLGRPVKWTDERSESFLSDHHGRDQGPAEGRGQRVFLLVDRSRLQRRPDEQLQEWLPPICDVCRGRACFQSSRLDRIEILFLAKVDRECDHVPAFLFQPGLDLSSLSVAISLLLSATDGSAWVKSDWGSSTLLASVLFVVGMRLEVEMVSRTGAESSRAVGLKVAAVTGVLSEVETISSGGTGSGEKRRLEDEER